MQDLIENIMTVSKGNKKANILSKNGQFLVAFVGFLQSY